MTNFILNKYRFLSYLIFFILYIIFAINIVFIFAKFCSVDVHSEIFKQYFNSSIIYSVIIAAINICVMIAISWGNPLIMSTSRCKSRLKISIYIITMLMFLSFGLFLISDIELIKMITYSNISQEIYNSLLRTTIILSIISSSIASLFLFSISISANRRRQ